MQPTAGSALNSASGAEEPRKLEKKHIHAHTVLVAQRN